MVRDLGDVAPLSWVSILSIQSLENCTKTSSRAHLILQPAQNLTELIHPVLAVIVALLIKTCTGVPRSLTWHGFICARLFACSQNAIQSCNPPHDTVLSLAPSTFPGHLVPVNAFRAYTIAVSLELTFARLITLHSSMVATLQFFKRSILEDSKFHPWPFSACMEAFYRSGDQTKEVPDNKDPLYSMGSTGLIP